MSVTNRGRHMLPVLRGLRLLERLEADSFGHEVRGLSLMLESAARRSEHAGTADAAVRREARQVAAQLWRLYPPEDDPLSARDDRRPLRPQELLRWHWIGWRQLSPQPQASRALPSVAG